MSRCENAINPTAAIERFYRTRVYEAGDSFKTSENNRDASGLPPERDPIISVAVVFMFLFSWFWFERMQFRIQAVIGNRGLNGAARCCRYWQ